MVFQQNSCELLTIKAIQIQLYSTKGDPLILTGKDVVAGAQTGTGKTQVLPYLCLTPE